MPLGRASIEVSLDDALKALFGAVEFVVITAVGLATQ